MCYVQNDTIKVTKSAHTVCIYSYLVQTEKSLFSLSTDLPIVAEVIQNLLLVKKPSESSNLIIHKILEKARVLKCH